MKEEKDQLQKKKVNRLTLAEAEQILDLLDRSDQRRSKKYKHVTDHVNTLKKEG